MEMTPEQEQLLDDAMLNGQIEEYELQKREVWDALAELFGEPTTESNRRLRGKITRSLKRAGATYGEILERAMSWPYHFPGATLTETALEKHWDRLARPPLRASEADVQKRLSQDEIRRRLR